MNLNVSEHSNPKFKPSTPRAQPTPRLRRWPNYATPEVAFAAPGPPTPPAVAVHHALPFATIEAQLQALASQPK